MTGFLRDECLHRDTEIAANRYETFLTRSRFARIESTGFIYVSYRFFGNGSNVRRDKTRGSESEDVGASMYNEV